MTHPYLRVIVPLAITLPLFFAFLYIRLTNKAERKILLYLIVSAITNLAAAIISGLFHENNLPLLHFFTAVEFVILSNFYKHILGEQTNEKKYLMLQLVFVAFCIFNAIAFQPLKTYNSYAKSLESIVIMLFSVKYFAKQFAETYGSNIVHKPSFWFNTGIFLYFSWSLMFFVFSNLIVLVSTKNGNFLLYMHATFVLIMYLLFATGFFKIQKHKISELGSVELVY